MEKYGKGKVRSGVPAGGKCGAFPEGITLQLRRKDVF